MASKSRRNKVKFKLTKELVLLVTVLLAMIVATIVMSIPSHAERALERYNTAITEYNAANETQYAILGEDNVYDEISFEKLKSVKNNEGYVYVFYGSLTNAKYLENLSAVNAAALANDVDKVYLNFNDWMDDYEDKNSYVFKQEVDKRQDALNNNVDEDQKSIDLLKAPALLVFNDGKLVFNTQSYEENSEYSWNMFINQAFTLGKESK